DRSVLFWRGNASCAQNLDDFGMRLPAVAGLFGFLRRQELVGGGVDPVGRPKPHRALLVVAAKLSIVVTAEPRKPGPASQAGIGTGREGLITSPVIVVGEAGQRCENFGAFLFLGVVGWGKLISSSVDKSIVLRVVIFGESRFHHRPQFFHRNPRLAVFEE